jgi:transposase InsO family protein
MGNSLHREDFPMPWHETHVMDERMSFIVDWQRDEWSFAALCRRYGVSRRTGYKWTGRFEGFGIDGLKDRSSAAHRHPNQVEACVAEAVIGVRAAHPSWGPKKIKAWLSMRRPQTMWPAQSTIAELLDRRGLVRHRRQRRHVPAHDGPLSPALAANDVWGIDFKGWFRTGNGARCEPLSLSDLASRYVLRVQALERIDGEQVWPILETAFFEFGLPRVMRSDNGAPFASVAAGGLSRLGVRLIKAGVVPERIEPGRPQQNGRHERMHLTLKQETASPPAQTLGQQQRRFDAFRMTFNEERPHEALGQTPPAQHYDPPPRPYSGRLREPDYADDQTVRRVRSNGQIKWRGEHLFLSETLTGEPVGLSEIDDGLFEVHYGPISLGTIDRDCKFTARKAGTVVGLARQPQPRG